MELARREKWIEQWRVFWRAATAPWLVMVWGIGLLYLLAIVSASGGSFIGGVLTMNVRHGCVHWPAAAIIESDGKTMVVDIGDPRYLEIAKTGANCAIVMYARRRGSFGLWAPTWETESEEFRFCGANSGSAHEVRALCFDYFVSMGERLNSVLRTRDVHRVRAIWAGHGVNLISLFALCAFAGSARRCFVRTMDRRTRRMLAGECPTCRYPIAGLPTPVCPECGEKLD